MAHRVPIQVRLDSFEGPLDLLLHLIQAHELDVSRVSIGRITDQYLAYVRVMHELNFDIASDFLVMAATLLHWKSKSLLPQDKKDDAAADAEEYVMTQEELIRQLLEHQRFLAAGQDLHQLPRLGEDVFTRPNRRPPIERVWKEMSITDLAMGYQDMLVRARKRTTVLRKETVSLADKLHEFADRLEIGKTTAMSALLSGIGGKPEQVVTFLASLELSRLKKLKLYQEGVYTEIFLELLETLRGFDPALASGFAAEVDQAAKDAATQLAADEAVAEALEAALPPELLSPTGAHSDEAPVGA